MTTLVRGDRSHIDGAAQVWAEATAARDGDPDVAPLEISRPIIASVFDRTRAVLVVALDQASQVATSEPLASTSTSAGFRKEAPSHTREAGNPSNGIASRSPDRPARARLGPVPGNVRASTYRYEHE